MTAEEKLKELYKHCGITSHGSNIYTKDYQRIPLTAEIIDLIANLVIERLNKRMTSPVKVKFGEQGLYTQ